MQRRIEREWLDELPPGDPRAVRSRRDLRRLNGLMQHASIIAQSLAALEPKPAAGRIVELGAGDGTLMLRVAQRLAGHWPGRHVVLVDRHELASPETRTGFHNLGWDLETVPADVFDWLRAAPAHGSAVLIANLFLHHFPEARLRELFQHAARNASCLVACEPRRTLLPLVCSRALGLIGCNAVTRHDAFISVRAGFTDHELSALWPEGGTWRLSERAAGGFSHVFVATTTE